MGFPRQEHWNGLPFPSPGDPLYPEIKPRSSTLQVDSLLSEPPEKPFILKRTWIYSTYMLRIFLLETLKKFHWLQSGDCKKLTHLPKWMVKLSSNFLCSS